MRNGWTFVAAALGSLATSPVLACGACIEDRVAAVYDYQVEQQAGRDGLRIAYLGVLGRGAESQAATAAVAAALRGMPAALAGTVRTSASPAAASFAWRGDESSLRNAIESVNGRLAASGLKVELLRTWDARRGLH